MVNKINTDDISTRHSALVKALTKPGSDILSGLTPACAHLLHMAIGISGEAGELLDAIKKAVIYKKAMDLDNIIEELGDLEFYMQGLRSVLNISRRDTLTANVKKLSVRYSEGAYSDKAAIERADKSDENETKSQQPGVKP